MQTRFQFFLSSAEAWQAMYADCDAARTSIDIEEYIIQDDEAGRKLLDILKRKALEGVLVRVMIDSAGSFSVTHSPSLLEELRESGIKMQVFNPINIGSLPNVFSWYFRDHRKILIVDDVAAHIGGVCLQSNMADWRDTQVRVEGLVVEQFSRAFDHMWENARLGVYARFPREQGAPDGYQVLINAPHFRQRYFYHELLSRIRRANKYVYITTPYFIPTYRFRRQLRRAVRRGVDVRLLLAHKSDHTFIDRASDFYVSRTLRDGIKIYRYTAATLHAKSAAIDGWATVGSTNIDNLSLLFNHEANLTSTDAGFVSEVKNIFEKDIARSSHVSKKEWSSRSFSAKFLEWLTWPLHGVL